MSTTQALRDILAPLEEQVRERECRVFPSLFDADADDVTAFPRPLSWRWSSCETALKYFGAQTALLRLPLFWQVEAPFVEACRNVGATAFCNERDNMPVGGVAITNADANVIVTDAADAAAFRAYLDLRKILTPVSWILVHRDTPEPASRFPDNAAHEVHIAPGVPILVQCPELFNSTDAFHEADDARIALDERKAVLEATDEMVPALQLPVASRLRERGECACGKRILEKL